MRRHSQLVSSDAAHIEVNALSGDRSQGTTAGAPLDPASLELLRSMFLLLDEWDRERMQESADSSDGREITIDLKSS